MLWSIHEMLRIVMWIDKTGICEEKAVLVSAHVDALVEL